MIVSHRERRITVHARVDDDAWSVGTAITGGRIVIAAADTELVVDEIYRKSSIT